MIIKRGTKQWKLHSSYFDNFVVSMFIQDSKMKKSMRIIKINLWSSTIIMYNTDLVFVDDHPWILFKKNISWWYLFYYYLSLYVVCTFPNFTCNRRKNQKNVKSNIFVALNRWEWFFIFILNFNKYTVLISFIIITVF